MALLMLAGCAGEPLERHEYLLRPQAAATISGEAPVVRLASLQVAPYLDQDGIVLVTGDAEIHAGRQHFWAERLDRALIRYLQVAIASAGGVAVEVDPLVSGRAKQSVAVRIHQLHGSMEGDVRLVAEWWVTNETGDMRPMAFDSSMRQRGDGYPALIDAHAELLDRLAQAIVEELD